MPASRICLSVLILLLVARVFAAENPVLEQLQAEAQALQTNATAWAAWNSAAEKILTENARIREHWRREGSPPMADLRPANMPLPFLVWLLQSAPVNSPRAWAGRDAIAHNPDDRRIGALLALRPPQTRDSDYGWTGALTEAATPEWAFAEIQAAMKEKTGLSVYSLAFNLLRRFAAELPVDMRPPAYDFVRRNWPKGPANGDGETYFDLLLRVDPARARRELIAYYGQPEDPRHPRGAAYDFYVVKLLEEHKGPSPEVAAAARKWLAQATKRQRELYGKSLRTLLLFSDPANELSPALNRIRELLRQQKKSAWGDELDAQVRAVLELDSPAAADALASLATQKAIPDITRWDILDWLVRRRHPALPEIFAAWLREERTGGSWLRKEAGTKWGDYGLRLLAEADRINARKK